MRARRLLILLMMLLLLLPQTQAERLTLYTRPGQVDEATPFQLRPTELSICSVTRAMGGVVVLANDDNYDSLSLYFWQDGMTEMRKLGGGFYWVMSSDTMGTAQESCEYSMSRVPNYRMPDLTHAISNLTSDGETLYALNRINGLIFKISETKDGLQTEDVCTMANLSCLNISYRDLETDKVYTYPASLTRMYVCGSVLAISVMQENGIKVVLVDLADGAIREIADESLEAMYEWADGELLLWRLEGSPNEISRSSGTYTLSRYSVATGEETLLSTGVPYKKRSECGAYDPYSGSYYDVRTRQIVRTTDFVQEDPVVTFPAANVNIAVTKDSIVGVKLSSVYVRSKENGDMTVLRIQSSNGASNTALQHFAEENPKVILAQETLTKSAMNAASLAARMSASADAPDILRLGLTPDVTTHYGIGYMTVLVVNPRTTNADLVGKLLAQVIADQEATAKCVLLADYDEPIEDSYYLIMVNDYEKTLTELRRQQENAPVWKKQGIQERINEEEASLQRYTVRERWTIAPKTIELYQQTILPMSYLRRPGILADSDAFSALVSQVHQGEISLEEFVVEADKLIEGLEQ